MTVSEASVVRAVGAWSRGWWSKVAFASAVLLLQNAFCSSVVQRSVLLALDMVA